jgi:hypothetical protein
MDINDQEIIDLFNSLEKNSVKYILVGGFATVLNGHTRLTQDVDIWLQDSLPNRKNLRKALFDIGLPDMPQIESIDLVPGWSSINLPSGFALDVMTELKGFGKNQFDECYSLSNEVSFENANIRFLHINQLIQSKKAAGRPKDLLDVEELEKIRKGEK